MEVGQGGERETAEWVNALLATFWSLLQPIVSRYSGFEVWSVTKLFSWLPPSGWNSKKSLLCNIEGDIQGGQR